jgi:hypothetical protein
MTDKSDMGKLRGRCYFAFLDQPGKGNPKRRIKDAWRLSLVLEDVEGKPIVDKKGVDQLKLAESLNLKIKDGNDSIPGKHVDIKRNATNSQGKPGTQPRTVNAKRQPWDFKRDGLVGNDSLVNVQFFLNEYETDDGDTWNSANLSAVQVVDLVKYEGGSDFEEEEGYAGEELDDDYPFEDEDEAPKAKKSKPAVDDEDGFEE